MKILKYGILLVVIFVASVYSAFFFEDKYEKLIRYLFEGLSSNNISFIHSRKYIHFASGQFVLTFGLFTVTLIFLLSRQSKKQIIINLLAATFLLIISTILFCYVDGSAKLIECTACDDGTRALNYWDINYDLIFMVSLITAILPSVLTEIKNMKRQRDTHHPAGSISPAGFRRNL
jgi:hypothetical protein